jgi:hypothetical protein
LRGYAFDPSLSIQLDTASINEIIFNVPWEDVEDMRPGPVGEYLEVVDVDPASGCCYQPVDLNDRQLLAQNGLPPSEGNPHFHQQMVYAVSMTTIRNFERALGRWALWSPKMSGEDQGGDSTDREIEYVPRLRICPHALREANAYYSPTKKALLFGYFPATSDSPEMHLPGGMVFTCLSHDIIAHETTHALLDGMHRRFIESTNPDTLAFHEGFADIVALFQHFTFPEVLRHQLAKTRGDLESENLLGQLAQQFGRAIGNYGALRDALGEEDKLGEWKLKSPNPDDYQTVLEPHDRGAILVGAIFDAFVRVYKRRVADLLRIATSGTGVLSEGALHPDLVTRLAMEASKAAQHILTICIRGLDYCPPVDLTFGEYLRALITADSDLVPDDRHGYRIALIESFRRRGIYPSNVRTLSVESLRWKAFKDQGGQSDPGSLEGVAVKLRSLFQGRPPFENRASMYSGTKDIRKSLHSLFRSDFATDTNFQLMTGLVLSSVAKSPRGLTMDSDGNPSFEIHSVQPAQRVGPDGTRLNQVIISITQKRIIHRSGGVIFRGGCTLILDLDSLNLRYAIIKRIESEERLRRQIEFLNDQASRSLRATYLGGLTGFAYQEPFALLHRSNPVGKEGR